MYIKKDDLTIVIVTFESDEVIFDCLNSIDEEINIIIVDNSNNFNLKNLIEQKYKNIKYILSSKNLGMGTGNNLGIKNVKTNFALILNPDVILEGDTINELMKGSKLLKDFAILAPISSNKKYPNYKLFKKKHISIDEPFKVKSVDGYAMLLNLKRLNSFENFYLFDENFFLFLENDDLCKRICQINQKIYIVPKSKINHLGGKAVNKIYENEIEISRNWHWIWSKFYFNRKHHGYIFAIIDGLPTFFSAIAKYFFYLIFKNHLKKKIYFNRCHGYLAAIMGKKSYYRPKIKN